MPVQFFTNPPMTVNRFNQLLFIIGMRMTGKTTYARKLAGLQHKKVLIIDTFDHPSYRDCTTLQLDELSEWSVTPYGQLKQHDRHECRIFGGDIQEILQYVFTVCYDALIIIEDAAKAFDSNIPRRLKMIVVDHRNRGLDVIMMFHSYADIAPYLCRGMWDVMITFRTEDDLNIKQTKFSKWHIIEQEQIKLRNQPDRHEKTVIYRE